MKAERGEGALSVDDGESPTILTCSLNLWSTANNVMQMRPANAIVSSVVAVRAVSGIRISRYNERAGIGA
jgi:hypothetical protein